jgi:hypothetical protein
MSLPPTRDKRGILWFTLLSCLTHVTFAAPLGTGFNYQGRFLDSGNPAAGTYDMRFTIYDAATSGTMIGSPVTAEDVSVSNGLFTAQLDFGAAAFTGEARWLEIAVRPGASLDVFVPLVPRQSLASAPHALFARLTDRARTADSVSWGGISGVPAGFLDGVDNDTTYSAGQGLSLGAGNKFNLVFAGAGTSNAAARSDHHHLGQSWSGAETSGLAVATTLTAGTGVVALLGRQATGSGAPVEKPAGVWGDADNGHGVVGTTTAGSSFAGYFINTLSPPSLGATAVRGLADGATASDLHPVGFLLNAGGEFAGRYGVIGATSTNSSSGYGVFGLTAGATGRGLYGYARATNGVNTGAYGQSDSVSGRGVYGHANANSGTNYGVYGVSDSPDGCGVFAFNSAGTAVKAGGSGVIQSAAKSYVFVPGHAMVRGRLADDAPFEMQPNGSLRIRHGADLGPEVFLPITLPSVLYGQPVRITTLRVYFRCEDRDGAYIRGTELIRQIDADSDLNLVVDSTSRRSNTATSYAVTPVSAFGANVLSADSGILGLKLRLWYGGTNFFPVSSPAYIQIGGVRVELEHE